MRVRGTMSRPRPISVKKKDIVPVPKAAFVIESPLGIYEDMLYSGLALGGEGGGPNRRDCVAFSPSLSYAPRAASALGQAIEGCCLITHAPRLGVVGTIMH